MSRGIRVLVLVLLVVAFAAGYYFGADFTGKTIAAASHPSTYRLVTVLGGNDSTEVAALLGQGWAVDQVVTRKAPAVRNPGVVVTFESYDYILRLDQ